MSLIDCYDKECIMHSKGIANCCVAKFIVCAEDVGMSVSYFTNQKLGVNSSEFGNGKLWEVFWIIK